MRRMLTDEQWQLVLSLSEAAADLPPQARIAFLNASGAPAEVIDQALTVISEFGEKAYPPDRVGQSVGRFRILEYCGSGGMGDVYRAHDTELDRTVALKFLRPAALEQLGAFDRFIREARTVSSLNHPNIVTVHEVLRSDEAFAIVMEYVEGTSIRAICKTEVPLKQVVAISYQIALALAAAHQRGIVHRDIKPENAILRPDGNVKVLDFGLAISLSRMANDASISASHLFAGTWRYMSPEQRRGELITAASDIFTLGLVICELATGIPPNGTLPDLTSNRKLSLPAPLPPNSIPRSLRSLLRAMLTAPPTQRPSAVMVCDELSEIQKSISTKSRHSLFLALVALVAICLCVGGYFFSNTDGPRDFLASPISVEPGYKYGLAFSPAGDRIAYSWDRDGKPRQIYIQAINSKTGAAARPVRLTREGLEEDLPAWSPDGRTLAFTRKNGATQWNLVFRDWITGRERIVTSFEGRSLTYSRDGHWLIAGSGHYLNHSVVLISPADGKQVPLTAATGDLDDDKPAPGPDAENVVFSRFFTDAHSRLLTVPLQRGSSLVTPAVLSWPNFQARLVRNPVYSSDGHDLFFIAELDSIARLYCSHNGHKPAVLANLGERIRDLAIPAQRNRIAFSRNLDDTNIWKLQLRTAHGSSAGQLTRVISSLRMDQRPAVSPDGTQIAFESDRDGFPEVWLANLSTGDTSPLTALRSQAGSPRWSPDGGSVVFDGRIGLSSSVFRVRATGGEPQRLTSGGAFEDLTPVVSPDGRWVYFTSNRAGRFQIWRIPFAGGEAVPQTNTDGVAPEVSADGQYLYYLERLWAPSQLWRKNLTSGRTSPVASDVFYRGYGVGRSSILFTRQSPSGLSLISASLDGRHPTPLATLSSSTVGGLSLNPKEDALYFGQLESSGDELMMANSF